jgi:positive regulator of sigma E activity
MAWELLFTSDIGLMSLFVIVFVLGMSVWFAKYFSKKMHEEEDQMKKTR